MWPLLLVSLVTVTTLIERIFFLFSERRRRDEEIVEAILDQIKLGDAEAAFETGKNSPDRAARMLVYGLSHPEGMKDALLHAAVGELKPYERGLSTLDTVITLAPLLGLLGTVTGMIHAFGLLGNQELGSPTAITGGIAEALIATACGLGIAITALVPFNFLNAQLEQMKHYLEHAATRLELAADKSRARCS